MRKQKLLVLLAPPQAVLLVERLQVPALQLAPELLLPLQQAVLPRRQLWAASWL
jgi:hypothetical protein